jgi:ATP-dependent DNA helicase DinG
MTIAQLTPQACLEQAFARLERLEPGFEHRNGQREMAALWADALERRGVLAVEAPTGIGKSLAYLLPAILLRSRGSGPIIVSTHTKALQDQLLTRDVPLALRAAGVTMRVVSLKGRSSYLCRRRAHARLAQRRIALTPAGDVGVDEGALGRLEDWVERTRTGEIEELAERGIHLAPSLLAEITSDPFTCAAGGCEAASGCFAKAARRDAKRADLIVVNHALLLSDPGFRSTLLAESGALILDEAHHLERVAREQQGVSLGVQDLARLAARTDAKKGALRYLKRALRRGRADAAAAAIEAVDRAIRPVLAHGVALARDLEGLLSPGVPAVLWPRGVDVASVSPVALDALLEAMAAVTRGLGRAADAAEAEGGAALRPGPLAQDALAEARGRLAQWIEAEQALRALARVEERGVAFYVDRDERGSARLNRRPLQIGDSLRGALFGLSERTLLTSATLGPGESLASTLSALGLSPDDVAAERLPSPFPLERQVATLVLDGPEPGDPAFVASLAELVVGLTTAHRRNTLVLFTSYQMLEDLAARVRAPLAAAGIPLLAQVPGGAAAPLAHEFRSGGASVLLGTASFWEGVDFPGEALEVLVIARLPFPVPTDPLVAARSERIAEDGGDPFRELMMPEALLRFRQGVGRLIRTATDRGAVVVVDPRIVRASYGARFVAALPARPRVTGSVSEITEAVGAWLA